MGHRILLVEDDPALLEALSIYLQGNGFECGLAADAAAAIRLLDESTFDVVLTDILLPGESGLSVLQRVSRQCPETVVVIMTAHATLDSALEAMRLGAIDYIAKPIRFEEAMLRLRRVLQERDRLTELRLLRREIDQTRDIGNIIGRSSRMEEIFLAVRKVAASASTVLITGESGTGKELIARAIHRLSCPLWEERFVAVNCAAIPADLLESELFGHTKGAFSGAACDKRGLFEMADGGTLFLDEIGEMNLGLQAKLLRAVESKEIRRVGGIDPIRLDVRIVCSTNRDLKQQAARREFREDLYYRIGVMEIRLPPLRERREDIPELVAHFVAKFNGQLKTAYAGPDNASMRALISHVWTGNVRELQNVIERAMILGDGKVIRMEDLPAHIAQTVAPAGLQRLRDARAEFERLHIKSVLESVKGDREAAAQILGIGMSSLYRLASKLGIELPEAVNG